MGKRGTEEGKEGEAEGRNTWGTEKDTRALKEVIPGVMCMRYCVLVDQMNSISIQTRVITFPWTHSYPQLYSHRTMHCINNLQLLHRV